MLQQTMHSKVLETIPVHNQRIWYAVLKNKDGIAKILQSNRFKLS